MRFVLARRFFAFADAGEVGGRKESGAKIVGASKVGGGESRGRKKSGAKKAGGEKSAPHLTRRPVALRWRKYFGGKIDELKIDQKKIKRVFHREKRYYSQLQIFNNVPN